MTKIPSLILVFTLIMWHQLVEKDRLGFKLKQKIYTTKETRPVKQAAHLRRCPSFKSSFQEIFPAAAELPETFGLL